jgi:hypothetical protein
VNDGIRILPFEITLESPVMGKAERNQCSGGFDGNEGDDIPAVMRVSDTCQQITRDRVQIRELDRVPALGSDFCV